MKVQSIFICICLLVSLEAFPQPRYSESLCHEVDYFCMTVKDGETWDSLFPDQEVQDIIMRVNRMNVYLKRGMILAIPKQLEGMSMYDFSPFPRYIEAPGEKTIYVNQRLLAWAAYDDKGELIWWGPISSGMGASCSAPGGCESPSGFFRVIRKQDETCISTAFPRRFDGESGGAEMPYCMHFFRGYALHGSDDLPGYRASHGCIRLFSQDAQWLNEEFVELPGEGGLKGTRVIVEGITG
ncbi:MAG: L,D-transpeptidase [Gammaproteobacteria bacterium]|nr:L,D-transpeptidase [Gammaproteobacteria bacterium]